MAPATLQPSALALVAVPAVLSSCIVIARIGKRTWERKFAIEDALLLIAQVLIIALTYTTWMWYKTSWYGYHYWDIPQSTIDQVKVSKWSFANAIVHNPILGLIKASFLITLIKLNTPNRWINYCLWITFTINGLFTIVALFVCAFQCNPVSRFWDKSKPGKCIDSESHAYGTTSIVLVTDVLVVIMPAWILCYLQMPFRHKLMTASFLSFGLAVTGIGAYRLWAFYNLYNTNSRNLDATYSVRQGLPNLEVCLASIGACGATVRWMLGLCIPFFAGQETGVSNYSHTNDSGFPREQKHRTYINAERSRSNGREAQEERPYLVPAWKNTSYRTKARGPKTPKEVDKSEEQGFVMVNYITKTTEWDVASGRTMTPKKEREKEKMTYEWRHVRPRDVV